METGAVSVEEFAAVPPEVAFDRFGAGTGAGWLFGATCDRSRDPRSSSSSRT